LWTRIARETAGVGTRVPLRRHPHLDATGGEHLHRGDERGLGQRVRVLGQEQRPVDALGLPVPAQIASVIARMCVSLKLVADELPRCPEVPKETRWRGFSGSGIRA
jgi:hypothetical protein